METVHTRADHGRDQLQPVVAIVRNRWWFILADDVGLGKTVQLGMAAELIELTNEKPVLVLAPKNLLLQWQEELDRMLSVPSARWVDARWVTEDGAVWPAPPQACPRRIGLFPTSLVTAESEAAKALLDCR